MVAGGLARVRGIPLPFSRVLQPLSTWWPRCCRRMGLLQWGLSQRSTKLSTIFWMTGESRLKLSFTDSWCSLHAGQDSSFLSSSKQHSRQTSFSQGRSTGLHSDQWSGTVSTSPAISFGGEVLGELVPLDYASWKTLVVAWAKFKRLLLRYLSPQIKLHLEQLLEQYSLQAAVKTYPHRM